MPKPVMPFFEPLPYYMSAMGMAGARFIEGNDGSGGEGSGKPGGSNDATDGDAGAGADTGTEGGNEGDKPAGDDELGEGGKKALAAERTRANNAEKQAKDAIELAATKDTEIQSLTQQVTEKDTAIAGKDLEIAKLNALLDFPVKKELRGLIQGTDEASFRASAELLFKNTSGTGVVHKSGTTGDDPNPSGGSIAAGREMYTANKPKKVGA